MLLSFQAGSGIAAKIVKSAFWGEGKVAMSFVLETQEH